MPNLARLLGCEDNDALEFRGPRQGGVPTMRNAVRSLVVCVAILLGGEVLAQERGTTTGPEGSEVGKGGYVSGPGGLGGFSITADGGGVIVTSGPQLGTPLFAGLTASYWAEEFYRIDLSGYYIPDSKVPLWGALIGPSFHTTTWPIAFSIGFQVGLIIPNSGTGVDFMVSPRVGMDWITQSHFQLGVFANWDINVAHYDGSFIRIGLSIGYRF
jgi:hypothetical protein